MTSFWRIFSLELTAFVRSKALLILLAVALAWMFAAPCLLTGDGTVEGSRVLSLHYSLGGVAAILIVALLVSATGSIAGERAEKRLQLTIVRPVRYFTVALAKIAALVSVGAAVLGAAVAVEAARADLSTTCRHVLSPILPTPKEEAAIMYDSYMKSPHTPDAVKRARKSVVLRILEQRAIDRYDTILTNEVAQWRFRLPDDLRMSECVSARLRFTNAYDLRQNVCGVLECGGLRGALTNITQMVVDVPLVGGEGSSAGETLSFMNEGGTAVMLRPRRDVNLLIPADAFGWNLLRAYVELVSLLSIIVSFGVFLGAGLGRPVALFTAVVMLAVSEMSPSVTQQYPDELDASRADAIGLYITRAATDFTHPVSSLEPLSKLSEDACVEPREVVRAVVANMLFAPIVFALLSALAMARKTEA